VLRKQDVVRSVAVERRVQVDEIDGLVLDVPPQDIEVVPVVEKVPPGRFPRAEGTLLQGSGNPSFSL
jgi:hypothetical protein